MLSAFRPGNNIRLGIKIRSLFQPPREVCQTQYETTCVTRYKETPVVEPVQECREECEEPLGGYRPRQGRDKDLDSGQCSQVCDTVRKTIIRPLPDTVCEKIPFEVRTLHC